MSASENSASGSQSTPAGSASAGIPRARCMGPVSATPCAFSHEEARMLLTITVSAPGILGTRSSTMRPASAARPQARLGQCHDG